MGRGCGTGGRAGKGSVTAARAGANAAATATTAAAAGMAGRSDLEAARRAKELARLRDMMQREAIMTKVNMSKVQRTWRRIMPNEKASYLVPASPIDG